MTQSYINAIGTANPEHKIPQAQVADFMAAALQMDATEKRRLMAVYRASGIESRYTVLPDYSRTNGEFQFFPNTPTLEPFPSISSRMAVFREAALPVAKKASLECLEQVKQVKPADITHLIIVSCTGMYAPGLDIELVHALGLPTTVERTAINFMGCYAAYNGIKSANHICSANPNANVLVVCVELCTLHFQKVNTTDHLLSNALFGDGAAALLISGKKHNTVNLGLNRFFCDLAPEGKDDMAWHVGDFGFEMTLTSYIPSLVKGGINQLTHNLLGQLNLAVEEVDYFAIHPGGRRILEAIEQALGLSKADNHHAYEVLRHFGNMSSATVLFVLKSIWEELTPADASKNILSFAFGPGLTLESMLLTVAPAVPHQNGIAFKRRKPVSDQIIK